MASKSINYYLMKIGRLSGWTLMALMAIYIVTGFSLCDKLGVRTVIDTQSALIVHQLLDWPLVVAFVVHSSITVYFAMKRWGWVKK